MLAAFQSVPHSELCSYNPLFFSQTNNSDFRFSVKSTTLYWGSRFSSSVKLLIMRKKSKIFRLFNRCK